MNESVYFTTLSVRDKIRGWKVSRGIQNFMYISTLLILCFNNAMMVTTQPELKVRHITLKDTLKAALLYN